MTQLGKVRRKYVAGAVVALAVVGVMGVASGASAARQPGLRGRAVWGAPTLRAEAVLTDRWNERQTLEAGQQCVSAVRLRVDAPASAGGYRIKQMNVATQPEDITDRLTRSQQSGSVRFEGDLTYRTAFSVMFYELDELDAAGSTTRSTSTMFQFPRTVCDERSMVLYNGISTSSPGTVTGPVTLSNAEPGNASPDGLWLDLAVTPVCSSGMPAVHVTGKRQEEYPGSAVADTALGRMPVATWPFKYGSENIVDVDVVQGVPKAWAPDGQVRVGAAVYQSHWAGERWLTASLTSLPCWS